MKIRCNRNEDSGSLEEIVLPIDCSYPISNQNFVCSSNWFIDSDGKQRCCINVGTIYMVYSIKVVQGKTHYLVIDDYSIPAFLPSVLFDIVDSDITVDWEVQNFSLCEGELLVIGYTDIVQDYTNLLSLVTQTPAAITKFFEYKHLLDKIFWGGVMQYDKVKGYYGHINKEFHVWPDEYS